ncbi:MAG: FAD-binding oxidoreductase [Candidatus Hydrogenedentes bacterium]|nr:FAD-binding oxidoreductase [Candidatus Hydrogenedentota bacterium]
MHLALNSTPFKGTPEAVTETGTYCPVSFWQETISVTPRPSLQTDINCDVAIVGGGFTGLAVACELKKSAPMLRVALLERSVAGHGASGRNGGFAMPLIGWDLTDAVRQLGEQKAAEAYRLMYEAVNHFKKTIRRHNIACDLEETGYLLLATCPARLKRVKHEADLGKRLGFDIEYLEGAALRAHIGSKAFIGGAYDPHPAIVNPAKLARGLLDVAVNLGVQVFEQTPLVELNDGDPITLRTPAGSIKSKQVVLALNGYGGALGFMESRIQPVHTYIVLTEPLTEKDLDAIGWAEKRTSLETARNFIHYFRLTADNRILFGGEDASLFYKGAYYDVHSPSFARLEARFRAYFPELNHVKITHRWGGVLGVTLDMFPTFGVGGEKHTIYHACGYSGHGVALSNYAGVILAPHILNRAGLADPGAGVDKPFFWNRRPMAVPGEPIRYLGLQAYRMALHTQDWWEGA